MTIQNRKDFEKSKQFQTHVIDIVTKLGAHSITPSANNSRILMGDMSLQYELVRVPVYATRASGQHGAIQIPNRRGKTAFNMGIRSDKEIIDFYLCSSSDGGGKTVEYHSGTNWDMKDSSQKSFNQFVQYPLKSFTFIRKFEDGFKIMPVYQKGRKTIRSMTADEFLAWWSYQPEVKIYNFDETIAFDPAIGYSDPFDF